MRQALDLAINALKKEENPQFSNILDMEKMLCMLNGVKLPELHGMSAEQISSVAAQSSVVRGEFFAVDILGQRLKSGRCSERT